VPDAAWRGDLLAWLAEPGADMQAIKAELRRRLPDYQPDRAAHA
jgi:DnaJ-domain-containing protein 1